MQNAGYAALQVVPTMKGARSTLTSEMQNSLGGAAQAGSQAGGRAGSGFAGAFSGALGAVGKMAGAAVLVGAGAITAFGVSAVKAGIEFNTLGQTSRAALTTLLGSSEAANAQMAKLDDFARTSPFAKDVFVSAQQQLIGFGMSADKVLPTLDAMQNAVAATGGSSQTLSEITLVMSQIQAAGKITGTDLMQFAQRGINAADLIGSQMGKTGAQIKDEITAGTLDAGLAMDALTAGMQEKFGGAAANVKETWVGATDRVKGATRDLGSALVEPFISKEGGGMAVEWANTLADTLRSLIPIIAPIAQQIGDKIGPVITSLLDKLGMFAKSVDLSGMSGAFSGLSGAILPLIGGLGGALAPLLKDLPFIGKLFHGMTGPIGLVLGLISGMIAESPALRQALGGAFQMIGQTLQSLTPLFTVLMDVAGSLLGTLGDVFAGLLNALLPPLMGIIEALLPVITQLATVLGGVLAEAAAALAPVLIQVADVIGQTLMAILPVVSPLLEALSTIFMALIEAVVPLIEPLLMIVSALLPLIPPIAQLIGALLPPLITLFMAILEPILALIPPIVDLLVPALTWVADVLALVVGWITTAIQWFTDLVTGTGESGAQMSAIWESVAGFLSGVWQGIADFFTGVWEGIRSFFAGIGEWFSTTTTTLWNGIKTVTSTVWNAIKSFLTGIWDGVRNTATSIWNGILDFFRSIPNKIFAGIQAVGQLGSKFAGWVRGVLDAVRTGFNNVINWVRDIPSKIVNALGNLGTLLLNAGKNIMTGFLNGITAGFNTVKDKIGGVGKWIADHKGPRQYDLNLLVPAGGWIMEGLLHGLESGYPAIKSSLAGFAADLASTDMPDLSIGVGTDVAPANTWLPDANAFDDAADGTTRRGGVVVHQTNYYPVPEKTSTAVDRAAQTLSLVGAL